MARKIMKYCLGIFTGLVVVYAIWVVVAINRSATISVDYVAKINEVASAVPEQDRAWPLYREAGVALNANTMSGSVFYDYDLEEPAWPDEEGWEHFDVWNQSHATTRAALHSATAKNGFGYVLTGLVIEEDKELWPETYASQGEAVHDGFVMSILFPQLGPLRQMAKLLEIDAKVAAHDGDAARCLQDLESMLRIGTHVREHPLLLSDLVSHSIYNITFATIGEIVAHEPTLFSKVQFAQLEEDLANLDENLVVRLDGERYFMHDLLQRIYTDDGNGDGRIIPLDATKTLLTLTESVSQETLSGSLVPALFAPIADVLHASRKEMLDEYTKRLDFIEAKIGIPFYELKREENVWVEPWDVPTSTLDPYFLVNLLVPALEGAILQGEYTRANRDATLAVLFAVQVHNETGVWPSDLAGAKVVDAWSGKPLLLAVANDEPIIYSVGFDQEDNGATHHRDASQWRVGTTGDWVIWPAPE